MKRNKLITLGLLLVSSIAITAPLLTSCASTTKEETIAPFFKSLSGDRCYSFSNVIANRIVLIDGINGRENVYYLSVKYKDSNYYFINEMRVSPETYIEYFVWKCNDLH